MVRLEKTEFYGLCYNTRQEFSKMNGIELLELVKQHSTFSELLQSMPGKNKTEIQSKRGNLFEKIGDLIIKFGFFAELPNDIYDHYTGNINTGKLKKITDLELYLRDVSVFSKAAGGASDITLRNKRTDKWIFISSKFYMDDSKKSIDNYDVEKIVAVTKQHAHNYKEYEIWLFVNNKQMVLHTIQSSQSTNQYIKDNIHHIVDIADMEPYFQRFKHAIQDIGTTDINATFCNTKISLEPRFHQDLITYQQMARIRDGERQLLLGAKPRSGKTYCVGGLFVKFAAEFKRLNALIITPAPTETISQFTDDLFHKFRDFNGINIIEIKTGADLQSIVLGDNNIIIVSKQLLDDYVFEKRVATIHALALDFIVFDENHFHGTTTRSKDVLDSYASCNTVRLYLTATYAKPLREWNVPANCQHFWDIEDEQMCKKRDVTGLVEKHGNDVLRFLTDETKDAALKVYDKMPDLFTVTNRMDLLRYIQIKENIKDTSYGFCNRTLLCGKFPGEVDMMLRYITGSHKELDYPDKDDSLFGRIKRTAIDAGSRTTLTNADFTSQIWFLPFGANMRIDTVSEHLCDRMQKNIILKNYEIKIVNSKKEYKVKDIKDEINQWEMKAKADGKHGLILLAGNQLTLGITLPLVDIVFLFNDITSSDKVVQMMYRSMTESTDGTTKKMGFVVDMNLSRVLNTLLDYKVHKRDLNVEQKITYLVKHHLMNIDVDLFHGEENETKSIQQLLGLWKSEPMNNLKTLLKKIEDDIIELDTKDQRLLNKYFTSAAGDNKISIQIQFDDTAPDALPTGIEQTAQKVGGDGDGDGDGDETDAADAEPEPEVNISLHKDVLPFVIPLLCILTLHTNHKDLLEMLNAVKSAPILLGVFRDQSFIWWNNPDIIQLIESFVCKYIKNDSIIQESTIQFKMSLQSLIDDPKAVLELIDDCLKPKQKEKQENGEVFTPMPLVFEMLEKLDAHYTAQHSRSIFTEPALKWFDPAAGMGNFPVAVYLKLMDGLAPQIPDDGERKKHIIENMLYMSELNKKNVFICHQIFNMGNQYKMNLYEGDTLVFDTVREWGVANGGFDVILGNPPYNKGGIRSHTGKQLGATNETIWTKFIERAFEWLKPDGFLAFINPLSWLKKSHSLHNALIEKHIVWLKLWDNSQSKHKINADIPISLYVLQNTRNDTFAKTEIVSEMQRRNLSMTAFAFLNPNYTIPLAFHSIFNKLAAFIERHQCNLEYNTKTIKSTGTQQKIPTDYSTEDLWAVDTYTIKDGLMGKKATVQHPDATKRKLIISNKASFTGAFIDDGKLGLTGNHKTYILGDNLELIKKILAFKLCDIISHFTKYGQDFLDNSVYTYIPDIRKLGITDITEVALYELIGFTPDEMQQINPLLVTTTNTTTTKRVRIMRPKN